MEKRVRVLEAEGKAARTRYDQLLSDFLSTVGQHHEEELQRLQEDFEREKNALMRTIRSLQINLEEKQRELHTLTLTPLHSIDRVSSTSTNSDSPRLRPPLTSIQTAGGDREHSFPIELQEISGEKVIVGTHESTRLVKTEEEYRDSFGDLRKRVRPEKYQIPEYGYQASALLLNQTDTMQQVTIRCGRKSESFKLGQDEEKRIQVDSILGAPLTITANGKTKTYSVPYP